MQKKLFLIGVFVLLSLACALRFSKLENRPVHHDEGVNGWFIDNFIEKGEYNYSPEHYHGPTFFYIGGFVSRIIGLSPFSIRLVAAMFGFLLCLAPLCLLKESGRLATLATMAALIVSPSLEFYSRYAIHEVLLVCFFTYSVCFLYLYLREVEWAYGIAAALFLASACASKETVVIYIVGVCLGLVGYLWWVSAEARTAAKRALTWKRLLVLTGVFFVGLLLWFRPKEILKFFNSYLFYFKLGTKNTGHEKYWGYFFELLGQYDWLVAFGGLWGAVVSLWKRKPWGLICTGWALAAVGLHAVIKYKTPWIVITQVAPLAFLTGIGVEALVELQSTKKAKVWMLLSFLALCVPTGVSAWVLSFRQYTDPPNRYAYVHSFASSTALDKRVKEIVAKHPEIHVAITTDESWPFPFLFRHMPQIIWYNGEIPPSFEPPELIIARDTQHDAILAKLKSTYRREDYGMRPGVNLQLYIQDRLLEGAAKP